MPPARILLRYCQLPAFLALMTLACRGQADDQAGFKKALKIIELQTVIDHPVLNEKNPSGLQIQFEKIDETPTEQGEQVRYRIRIPGAPENSKYQLAMMSIHGGRETIRDQAYVNAKGLLMESKPRRDQENKEELDEESEVEVAFVTAHGEPVRFWLISADQKKWYPGTVVPHPIESVDGECRLEARLGFPNAEAVLIYADGLPPNTEVPYQSTSESEAHTSKLTVDAKGHAQTVIFPNVKGQESGVLKVWIENKECTTSVEAPWGKGSYKRL
jgi:hypothetical protein